MNLGGDLATSRELTRQRVLAEFGTFALRYTDAPDLFDEAARQIGHASQLGHVVIALYRETRQDFQVVASLAARTSAPLPEELVLTGAAHRAALRALGSGHTVSATDCRDEDGGSGGDSGRRLACLATIPILKGGMVAGVIEIGDPHPRAMDADDVYLAEAMAYLLGAALARMEAEAERDALLTVLRESERRFRFMAESIPHVVWTADGEGAVDYFNGRWTEYTGMSVTDGMAGRWSEAIHPDDIEATRAEWGRAKAVGSEYRIEHRIRRADGGWRWMVSRAWPMRSAGGAVIRWFGTATDIDGERQARQTLLEARDAAERANRAKSRFLAAASHDLRQPLNAVTLLVGVLRSRLSGLDLPGATDALTILERIDGSLGAMIELFESLLDLSKLESGTVSLDVRPVPLAGLLNRLEQDFAPAAGTKGLRFRVVPSSAWVATDLTLLERMLRNLVANAVRYTQRGGVLVGVRHGDGTVRIEVVDTGPGIAQEHRDEIFDEFRQLQNEARVRGGGHGLGLAIVRRAGALLRHPVRLDSRIGHGSRFGVEVPLVPPESAARPDDAPAPASIDDTGHRVLVIEDDSLVLTATKLLLEQYGCVVMPARTAAEALTAVNAGVAPSTILADFRLPGDVDGLEAVRMLRTALGREVPAILVTGDVTDLVEPRAREQNVQLLRKPVKPDELAGIVRRCRGG